MKKSDKPEERTDSVEIDVTVSHTQSWCGHAKSFVEQSSAHSSSVNTEAKNEAVHRCDSTLLVLGSIPTPTTSLSMIMPERIDGTPSDATAVSEDNVTDTLTGVVPAAVATPSSALTMHTLKSLRHDCELTTNHAGDTYSRECGDTEMLTFVAHNGSAVNRSISRIPVESASRKLNCVIGEPEAL